MGLLLSDPEQWLKGSQASDNALIDARVAARLQARKQRDYARADLIRSELASLGIILEDRPDGTTDWRKA